MSMTKSREKIEREQAAAKAAARKWIDDWLADYRSKFRVTLGLAHEMHRWRSQGVEPYEIWMGPADMEKWRAEAGSAVLVHEYYGVPIIRVDTGGIEFRGHPEAYT